MEAKELSISKTADGIEVCYKRNSSLLFSPFRISKDEDLNRNTLHTSLPFFIMQLFVANVVYRFFFFVARYLRIPPFVAQILCGLLIGPSGAGETRIFKNFVLPYRYTAVLETFANFSLIFYMFLLGLEIDLSLIKRSRTKALSISVAGILVSFFVALLCFYQYYEDVGKGVFWAAALGDTSFSDLVRILSDLKLLRTETGKTAMSAAIISDLITWIHLIFIVSIFNKVKRFKFLALTATIGFLLICWFLVRPALSWIVSKTTKAKDQVTETQIWFVFAGIVLFGLITDALGAHSIVGAFMFGVIMPDHHPIKNTLVEKLDDFVSAILMPLFYITSGLRTDIWYLFSKTEGWTPIMWTIVGCCAAKIVSTYVVSFFYRTPSKDSLALGLLMNTKGILSLIIINVGRDMNVLDSITFPQMVLVLFTMSCLAKPILYLSYKPKKAQNKHKTMEKIQSNAEFRVLACVHNLRNASAATSLLRDSKATPQSPLFIFAIHLIELTGRTTASMLVMDDEYKTRHHFRHNKSDHVEDGYILNAFGALEEEESNITTHTVTVVSPYETMHEDICSLAEDKCVSLIILPFHKEVTSTGNMEEENIDFANVNQNVLKNAPCSVGILVDNGMNISRARSQHGSNRWSGGHSLVMKKNVIMFFLGGPDDREALTYAWRMTGNPKVKLTVVRFQIGEEALMGEPAWQREKKKDEELLYEFRFKTMNDPRVLYMEKVVNDGAETIKSIREIENDFDLCIVGRGKGLESQIFKGLSEWETSLDLGIIGDAMASSTLSSRTSVLVVQQYSTNKNTNYEFENFSTSTHIETTQLDAKPFMSHSRMDEDDEDDDEDHH